MKTFFDIRVPDAMITGYSKKSLGKGWGICKKDCRELDEAWCRLIWSFSNWISCWWTADTVKKESSISKPGWELKTNALAVRIEGLRGQGDVEAAKELFKLVMERCHFEPAINDKSKTQLYWIWIPEHHSIWSNGRWWLVLLEKHLKSSLWLSRLHDNC